MTSAEKPKINGYTQITIYYHVTEITTQYSHLFVGTRARIDTFNTNARQQ